MSEQRNLIIRFLSRQRRWVTAGIGVLGVSGLVLGGLASPSGATVVELDNHIGFSQWADVAPANWTTGDLNFSGANASTYTEGETVPFMLDVTSAGAGTWSFSVCRDYSDGTNFGYLSLAAYNTSRSPLVAPAPTSANGAFSGGALVGSVNIDSVHEVGAQGACHAGQRETDVQITVAGGLGGAVGGAYVLWGGHLASPADPGVGVGHGAGQYNGATLAMEYLSGKKTLNIKVAEAGAITVQKQLDSGSAQLSDFCFNISPNPAGLHLPLCADATGTATFLGLTSGNYTVSEAGLAGYTFASGSGTNCTVSAGAGVAAIVAAGTTTNATCVFHNRREQGTLTVNDVVDPGTDPGRFDLQIDGSTAGSGGNVGDGGTTGAITVSAGTHPVGATGAGSTDVGDYTTSTSCVDSHNNPVAIGGGSVDVPDGENVVCTVTLTPVPVVTTTQPAEVTVTTEEPTSTTVTTEEPTSTTVTTEEPTSTTVTTEEPTSTTVTTEEPTSTTVTTEDPTSTTVTTLDTTVTTVAPTTETTDPADTDTTLGTTVTTEVTPTTIIDQLPSSTTTTTIKKRPKPTDDDNPGGDDSADVPSSTTTTTAIVVAPQTPVDPGSTVAGNNDQAGTPAPEQVLGGEVERPAPAPMPAATLPRTGRGIAGEVLAAFALLITGLALRISHRRKPAGQR